MNYQKELQAALAAVTSASRLCREVQAALVNEEALQKRDRSPVTVADFGVQAVVMAGVLRGFPSDKMVGEEDSSYLRQPENNQIRAKVVEFVRRIEPDLSPAETLELIDRGDYSGGGRERYWTLDPIDGTKGFLRNEQYALALALIEEGEVVMGVLGCPNLPLWMKAPGEGSGCIFSAVKGSGAGMKPLTGEGLVEIEVDSITDISEAVICESVEKEHTSHDDSAEVARRLGVKAPALRIDSQCKYGAVARGDASIYLRLPTRPGYVEKIWDHAAGSIIVEEAGGEVSDIYGRRLDFSRGRTLELNKGVVVTNGIFHQATLTAVKAALRL